MPEIQTNRSSRRRFLKYAAGTVAIIGASALGLDYLLSSENKHTSTSTLTSTSTSKADYPPVIDLVDVRPKYINPTDAYDIRFTLNAHDPDGDSLTPTWTMDGKTVVDSSGNPIRDNPYITKLPVGSHLPGVSVSDGKTSVNGFINPIIVDPDQLSDPAYQSKPLRVKFKGIRYTSGAVGPTYKLPIPSTDEMDEQLDSIKNELGCNAVTIFSGSGYDNQMIEGGKLAIQKGFERIYINPDNMDLSVNATMQRIESLSKYVKTLRETSDAIVFMVGHEFDTSTFGLYPGNNWSERVRWATQNHSAWTQIVAKKIPEMFERIIEICKQNYGYNIAYASSIWEFDSIPWSNPIFGEVDINAYLIDSMGHDETWLLSKFLSLKKFGKPIFSTEWGSMTFKGAGTDIVGPLNANNYPYDEDEQAIYIKRYFQMLNAAGIAGSLYTQYNTNFDKGYGLYNGMKRKKGFYMFKSFERNS